MSVLVIAPTRSEFRQLAVSANVVPVFCELLGDVETPISAFHKLGSSGHSFLFESAEQHELSGRYSFIGVDPHTILQSRGQTISIEQESGTLTFDTEADPLTELEKVMRQFRFAAHGELPPFAGGAVGFAGYETVKFFEPTVPLAPSDDLGLPDTVFAIMKTLLIFDHRLRRLKVLANAFIRDSTEIDQSYDAAVSAVEAVVEKLRRPGPSDPIDARAQFPTLQPECNQTRTEFEGAVEQAREFIGRGDIFQVVLSQRFKAPCQADALDLYRSLRMINPSPYMFCLRFGDDFSLVGSSPEMHIRVTRGKIEVRPIAGTRRRGATAEEDAARAAELLSDPKERAEHVMLVDLARNDIGRVSDYGSVRVTEYMTVERYSHVMHIVSHVTGRLRADVTPYDALRATFPAGTVSGAPKIRAMQIISELEPTRRGCYAGVVAYIGFDGGFDSCIALRSVVLKNGEAFVQAGAGVVADSSPSAEYHETISKAGAVLEAIARVAHLRKS